MSFNLSNCKYDFASDNINIFVNIYDMSSSMEDDIGKMQNANRIFYDEFMGFEEKGSIAIAKAVFADGFEMGAFRDIKDFNTGYRAYGNTALYNAIIQTAKNTIAYYNEIVKRLNVRPRITFLVFSDGGDNIGTTSDYNKAKEMIKQLNSLDATTVFVAFRGAIANEDGKRLGFTCTKDIKDAKDLSICMGKELSRSCREQSKSAYSLKSEFFSKADKNSNEDKLQDQLINDDELFDI